MSMAQNPEVEKIIVKYKERLGKELGETPLLQEGESVEYESFREQYITKKLSWYEQGCSFAEHLVKIQPDKKKLPKLEESIKVAHLNITPIGATAFAILVPLIVMFTGIFLSTIVSLFFTGTLSRVSCDFSKVRVCYQLSPPHFSSPVLVLACLPRFNFLVTTIGILFYTQFLAGK